MSEKQKLDKIVAYVINTLNYDYSIYEQDTNKNAHSPEDYYKKGALYGALNGDNNAICGNYASLTKALCKEVGIDNFYISSEDHSWNVVEIEGKTYHIDTTFIDTGNPETETVEEYDKNGQYIGEYSAQTVAQDIEKGKGDKYKWYLETPKQLEEYESDSHEYVGFPDYMEDSSNKLVSIRIDNKVLPIYMGGLVGIFEAIGLAKRSKTKVSENKEVKKR